MPANGIPNEQAGFWRGKLTVDEVILLTENNEDFLSICQSDGSYDFVWHHGFTCKLHETSAR